MGNAPPGPARCKQCYYLLSNLPGARCPECGLAFDLNDPQTYTTALPFVRWKFWLPGFILALSLALALFLVLIPRAGFGWSVAIVTPLCIGALVGYSCRVGKFSLVLLSIGVAGGAVVGLAGFHLVGVFCGAVTGLVIIAPILLGALLGLALRASLKRSRFDQRWHLPTLLLILVPLLSVVIEARLRRPYPVETVMTTIIMPVSAQRAWNSVMFYEEVRHRPPFLLRHALPRPLLARGSTAQVGDQTVCVYSKGRLVKQVTKRQPPVALEFDVVQQVNIENRSIRPTTGSFSFDRVDEEHTRVSLRTSYEPLLGPRWEWRQFERLAVHQLHGHVLEGMRLKACAETLPQDQVTIVQSEGNE